MPSKAPLLCIADLLEAPSVRPVNNGVFLICVFGRRKKYSAENCVNMVLTQQNPFFLYSWALLHLTMVKLVLHNVKNFFPIAGLEFNGTLNSPLCYSSLEVSF